MSNLKEVRKKGRECLLSEIPYRAHYGIYICFSKNRNVGFYYSEYRDGNEVFRLFKNGSLERIVDTEHSRNFHNELKHRRRIREKAI